MHSRVRQKIVRIYNNSSIKRKFVLILLCGAVVPILLVQLLNYLTSTRIMSTHLASLRSTSLMQTHNDIDTVMRDYYRLLNDLSDNSQVSGNVANISVWDVDYQLAQRALRSELKTHINDHEGVLGIALVATNREYVFYDRTSLSALKSYCFDFPAVLESPLVKSPISQPNTEVMQAGRIDADLYGEKDVIYLSYSVSDLEHLERLPIGTVVLCIDEASIRSIYTDGDSIENASASSMLWLMNTDGNIFSSSDPSMVGQQVVLSNSEQSLEEAVEAFVKHQHLSLFKDANIQLAGDETSKFVLVSLEDQSIYLAEIYKQGIWILIAGFLLIYVVSVSINFTSKKIDNDVHSIVSAMQSANAGQLDVRIDNEGEDEFALISKSFNDMIQEMKALINREKQAQDRKREAEIRALESQINPHFLYNTLDSINWVAIDRQDYEVSKMLMYLAHILRYSISKSNEVVTLKEELEHLQKYIALQQHRFQYSFLCFMNVDDELLNCQIHKLLLQPLIENCIEHAFPGPTGDDLIQIDISRLGSDRLQIVVSDNGYGMSQEKIDELNHFAANEENYSGGIGLQNVFRRVNIYYGEQGSFRVEANEKHGCRIILTISYWPAAIEVEE